MLHAFKSEYFLLQNIDDDVTKSRDIVKSQIQKPGSNSFSGQYSFFT